MFRKYLFWLRAAAVFQLLTAVVHSIGLFINVPPANDTEKQLHDLMNNYKMDLGAGFNPTLQNLFTALSACFSLVCLFGGWLNLYLPKKLDLSTLKGLTGINVVIFGICFGLMAAFTFLPPIIMTGIVFLFLLVAYLIIPNKSKAAVQI